MRNEDEKARMEAPTGLAFVAIVTLANRMLTTLGSTPISLNDESVLFPETHFFMP